MALVAPISQVRLMSVPFEIDYNHVIDFRASAGSGHPAAQTNYFLSLPSLQVYDFMYIRQNTSIKVPFPKDQVMYYNYCMYKNNQFSDKWFYAFITDVQYINPNTSEVFLSTDVFQTYYFDLSFKTSFIEREHQNRWTPSGSPIFNIVPENLDIGNNYMIQSIISCEPSSYNNINYLVCSNHPLVDGDVAGINLDTGFAPVTFLYTYLLENSGRFKFITEYSKPDSKISPYIISVTPIFCDDYIVNQGNQNSYGLSSISVISASNPQKIKDFSITPASFSIIPPPVGTGAGWAHESKLLTFPYSCIELAMPDGNSTIYNYEFLQNATALMGASSFSPFQKTSFWFNGSYLGANNRNNPQVFSEANSNYDVGLISSAWANYMASNKASFTLGVFTQGVNPIIAGLTSLASGNPIGAFGHSLSALSNIANSIGKLQDLKSSPGSTKSGASDFFIDMVTHSLFPKIYLKQIHTQFLEICGDYFMKFGYKCNRVKIPNTLSRHRFNFLKTINCEFTGDIPQDDLSALKSIFDKGVTLWHEPSFFLDYYIDNTEQNRY